MLKRLVEVPVPFREVSRHLARSKEASTNSSAVGHRERTKSMSNDEWLERLQVEPTSRGARPDLQFYVYRDGHGSKSHLPDAARRSLRRKNDDRET